MSAQESLPPTDALQQQPAPPLAALHYPDVMPSSALYWVGPRTADGKCPPGVPCSQCVNYTKLTPNCDLLQ